MDQIIIRKAVLKDLDKLYTFEQGIIATERPFDPTLREGLIHYYDLKEMVMDAGIEVAVAVTNDQIIGSGYARIEKSKPYLKHETYAYLGFMYVVPDYRGQGINKKIIEHLKEWAYDQNVKEIRLEVYFNNTSAIKAYEKIGFSKHMLLMRYTPEEEKKV